MSTSTSPEGRLSGVVVAEPEIGGGADEHCSVVELYGQVIIVHECLAERGVYYRIISDGPVEVTAPEVRIKGKLIVTGDVEITGNTKVNGNTRLAGELLHDGDAVQHGATQQHGNLSVDGNIAVTGDVDVQRDVTARHIIDRSIGSGSGFLP